MYSAILEGTGPYSAHNQGRDEDGLQHEELEDLAWGEAIDAIRLRPGTVYDSDGDIAAVNDGYRLRDADGNDIE